MNTTTINQSREMPSAAAPGEILLFIDLHQVENMTSAEVFKLAESLGFPVKELRYRALLEGMGLYAILHREQRDPDSMLESDYVTDEAFEELSERIEPHSAVHFRYSLKRGRVIEV